jgi:hypothetical protein
VAGFPAAQRQAAGCGALSPASPSGGRSVPQA